MSGTDASTVRVLGFVQEEACTTLPVRRREVIHEARARVAVIDDVEDERKVARRGGVTILRLCLSCQAHELLTDLIGCENNVSAAHAQRSFCRVAARAVDQDVLAHQKRLADVLCRDEATGARAPRDLCKASVVRTVASSRPVLIIEAQIWSAQSTFLRGAPDRRPSGHRQRHQYGRTGTRPVPAQAVHVVGQLVGEKSCPRLVCGPLQEPHDDAVPSTVAGSSWDSALCRARGKGAKAVAEFRQRERDAFAVHHPRSCSPCPSTKSPRYIETRGFQTKNAHVAC